MPQHALDLTPQDWQEWTDSIGAPPFVAKQIQEWIYAKKNLEPKTYSNLPLKLRDSLIQSFLWELPEVDCRLVSKDESIKYLLKTQDGKLIEMVLMPYEGRSTLCLSSQVGCKMGCTFCQTGKMGFSRDLLASEILGQLFLASQTQSVTNVVFMGMGEPLDNYQEVVKACRRMIDPAGLALSKSKVTVSTSGLIPEIEALGKDLPVRLAISLHTADDSKRSKMMPINRRYPLAELKKTLISYPAPERYGITFEYVMIEGENDSIEDAKKLVSFLHGIKGKVNLIPMNAFPGVAMEASRSETIRTFQKYLTDRSIPAPVRYSRGQDISAACGQLAAKRESELALDPRVIRRRRAQDGEGKVISKVDPFPITEVAPIVP
jgi:23S rRNA (adenine2503-C2)-methyltransferase